MFPRIEVPNTPVHTTPPPLIELKGTHGEIGRQMGEARREQIRHSIANARELIDQTYDQLELTWEGAQIQARKYLPFVEERYPQYGDELRGIAEGADVAFDDVFALNTMEAVTMDALHLTRCTSFAVNEQRTADGHILAAHTEDRIPEDEDDVFVVLVKPNDEAPFLAMTYGGLLPNVGVNANGIGQLIDTVYPSELAHRDSDDWWWRARSWPPSGSQVPSGAPWSRIAPLATTTSSPTRAARCTPSKSPQPALRFCMARMGIWCTPTTTWRTQ